jgi:RNA recognition motif-containing protein
LKIYIGNLGRETTAAELRRLFVAYGTVTSVTISYDDTGPSRESRGFAFVEMPVTAEAQAALSALDGQDMNGRPLILG